MNHSEASDPFQMLGVSRDASEVEVRARYLELVKQYTPEREPERFREIRAAYEAAKDPLSIAKRLVAPPDDNAPQWSEVLKTERRNPPRLSPAFLLSLGNRAETDASPHLNLDVQNEGGVQNRISPGNKADAS